MKYTLVISIIFLTLFKWSVVISPVYAFKDTTAPTDSILSDTPLPYYVVLNTMHLGRTDTFVIKNNDTTIVYIMGNKEIFYLKDIRNQQTITAILPPEGGNVADSAATYLLFDIDSTKIISSVRVELLTDSTTWVNDIDSLYFFTPATNELVLYPDPDPTRWLGEEDTNRIRVVLDEGIYISPNGDALFDNLTVLGLSNTTAYEIKIYDINNSMIYTSTDKLTPWDCRYQDSDILVPTGAYHYHIIADTTDLDGQLLLKY